MFKRWISRTDNESRDKDYELRLIAGKSPRVILERGDTVILYWSYEWYEQRQAEKAAQAIADLGSMELVEQEVWAS